jgi:hypothetical protein
MSEKRRTLGDVADDLRGSAQVARRAIASAIGIGTFRDEAASELAQAVVLLNRAAARFDLVCGLEDPVWGSAQSEKESTR